MADKKLSELESAVSVDPSDLVYVSQGGVSKKANVGQLSVQIVKPTITSPTTGTTDFSGQVTASAYTNSEIYQGTHSTSQWQAATDVNFSTIVDSYTGSDNLTTWTPIIGMALQDVYVRVRYESDGHLSAWSDAIMFITPNIYIETPTLSVAGSPSDVDEAPTLTTSAFSVYNGTDTHASTDWVIEDEGVEVWSSIGDASNKTSITVPEGILVESTLYTFKARHNGTTYVPSGYGVQTGTTKAMFFDYENDFGEELEGGYYAGKITRQDGTYAVIVSPRATGQAGSTLKWKNTQETTGACLSLNDGSVNTAHMVADGDSTVYPAAHFCNDLSIDGYTDWYLPARDELELAYRNLKPTTRENRTADRNKTSYVYTDIDDGSSDTMGINRHSDPTGAAYTSTAPAQTSVTLFSEGNIEAFNLEFYWSSTEYSGSSAWFEKFSGISAGNQSGNIMTTTYAVRAFRSFKIS